MGEHPPRNKLADSTAGTRRPRLVETPADSKLWPRQQCSGLDTLFAVSWEREMLPKSDHDDASFAPDNQGQSQSIDTEGSGRT